MKSLLNRILNVYKWRDKLLEDEENEFWDSVRYEERSRKEELNDG